VARTIRLPHQRSSSVVRAEIPGTSRSPGRFLPSAHQSSQGSRSGGDLSWRHFRTRREPSGLRAGLATGRGDEGTCSQDSERLEAGVPSQRLPRFRVPSHLAFDGLGAPGEAGGRRQRAVPACAPETRSGLDRQRLAPWSRPLAHGSAGARRPDHARGPPSSPARRAAPLEAGPPHPCDGDGGDSPARGSDATRERSRMAPALSDSAKTQETGARPKVGVVRGTLSSGTRETAPVSAGSTAGPGALIQDHFRLGDRQGGRRGFRDVARPVHGLSEEFEIDEIRSPEGDGAAVLGEGAPHLRHFRVLNAGAGIDRSRARGEDVEVARVDSIPRGEIPRVDRVTGAWGLLRPDGSAAGIPKLQVDLVRPRPG